MVTNGNTSLFYSIFLYGPLLYIKPLVEDKLNVCTLCMCKQTYILISTFIHYLLVSFYYHTRSLFSSVRIHNVLCHQLKKKLLKDCMRNFKRPSICVEWCVQFTTLALCLVQGGRTYPDLSTVTPVLVDTLTGPRRTDFSWFIYSNASTCWYLVLSFPV